MRILWLKTELLHPVDKGGRIRTYHMLRTLRRDHHITFLTLDDGNTAADAAARAPEYCDELVRIPFRTAPKRSAAFYLELAANLASPLPYAVWKYRSPAMRRTIASYVRAGKVDVVVCDFLFPSVNVPRDLPCPTVLFQHNVEAMIWRRHWEVARRPPARAYLRSQWTRMQAYEASECRRYDHVVAVSEQDLAAFRENGVRDGSFVATGVDTDYFRPSGRVAAVPDEIVFTGSMDWLPNEDAVVHFAEQILPRIRPAVPAATFTIVGRHPSPRVMALAQVPGVTVTGAVPDVRPYLERAAVVVVPLRIGGGTRLKIFEAMAMRKAVVSTAIGAEGLPVHAGEELLLADEPAAFADAVVGLLESTGRAAAIGARAAARVRAEFGWARVADAFALACARAVRIHDGDRTSLSPMPSRVAVPS